MSKVTRQWSGDLSHRKHSLADLYRHSPLFTGLRDSTHLKGKCAECEFREVCGGSRARAYALTGDMFAEEPCCVWQPTQRFRAAATHCDIAAPKATAEVRLSPVRERRRGSAFGLPEP